MEKKESVKDLALKTKESFTIKKLVMALIVLLGTAASVAADWIIMGFDTSTIANVGYWINLIMGRSMVIIILLSTYSFFADTEEDNNTDVNAMRSQLSAAHFKLAELKLMDSFDEHVAAKNLARKTQAYSSLMQCKILKAKTDKKRTELRKQMEEGLKNIQHIKIKYTKIKITEIFSRTRLIGIDDDDMSDGAWRTKRHILINKVIGIVAFGVLGSTLAFDFAIFDRGALVKTLISLFQVAYAIYCGASEGIRFVRGNLLSALKNRAQFVQRFIEQGREKQTTIGI